MEPFTVELKDMQGIPVIEISGYYNAEAGDRAKELVAGLLGQRKNRMVFDFSKVVAINSPGVTRLMDLSFEVIDDHQGKIVLAGLNALTVKVLTLANILPMVDAAPTVEAALQQVQA